MKPDIRLLWAWLAVHIDEKWFYRNKKNQTVYLAPGEEPPHLETKNKGYIQKKNVLIRHDKTKI
jgi:hypothetical protein